MEDFNPRAHEGHDSRNKHDPLRQPDFNPRAHEGHDMSSWRWMLTRYFNPRAHEGHDADIATATLSAHISIHVPTRGTTAGAAGGLFPFDFNPRAHEGHD